ncbi:MAG: hypothetical protein ACKVW3_09120 [Phycisphaerales bacterium]
MNRTALVCTSVSSLALMASAMLVAGPLTPPGGPVASTYKTLTEVEPRVLVSATNTPSSVDSVFTISQPGSYYLAGNVAGVSGRHGIKIDADGVTLDLRGFEVLGAAGTLDGVRVVPGRRGVTVRDGTLRGWKGAGVSAVGGPNADGCIYQNLCVIGNGTDENSYALDVGGASSVVNCMTAYNLGTGIRGNNGTLISGSTSSGNGGDGIICGAGTVVNCLARGNVYDGIRVGSSVISGCTVTANSGGGIVIHDGSIAKDNTSFANGWGVYIYSDGSRAEGNTIFQNVVGVEVVDAGNFVVRNTFRGNTTTDLIVPGNDVGPFEFAATGTSPWGNLRQ